MRSAKCLVAAVMVLAAAAPSYAADGLSTNPDAVPWARWQGRLSLGTGVPDQGGSPLASLSLVGDYYFACAPLGSGAAGGFRATSGVVFGSRAALGPAAQPGATTGSAFSVGRRLFGTYLATPAATSTADATTSDSAPVPYVGVGYTGLSARAGWSFNADLGLAALGLGSSVKLGRAASNSASLDDQVRDVRLTPVLQLGVSYAF